MATAIVLAASPRAAMLSGIVPLLLAAGLIIIALAAPGAKERLHETKQLILGLTPRPLRSAAGRTEDDNDNDTNDQPGWQVSQADDYSEFFPLIEGRRDQQL